MTDKDLARQFACTINSEDRVVNWLTPFLAALAAARAEEREACARVAEGVGDNHPKLYQSHELPYESGFIDGADTIAAAIRARSTP